MKEVAAKGGIDAILVAMVEHTEDSMVQESGGGESDNRIKIMTKGENCLHSDNISIGTNSQSQNMQHGIC